MSERNKNIAIAFYDKLINDFDPETAFELYGGSTYRQHTPVMQDGREGVTKFIHSLRENYPNSHMEIMRSFFRWRHGHLALSLGSHARRAW